MKAGHDLMRSCKADDHAMPCVREDIPLKIFLTKRGKKAKLHRSLSLLGVVVASSGKPIGQPTGASRPPSLRAAPFVKGNILIERGAAPRHEQLPL